MGMKVLIVGGGGREHALAWKIAQSPLVDQIYCAPGNAGIADVAECIAIGAEDLPALRNFAVDKKIDLTVVGPEVPLTLGITDLFQEAGLLVFGPSRTAAEIEGSKAFMKSLFAKYHIPTAEFRAFTDAEEARAYVREKGAPIVVKTSGLAAGKGAIVCQSLDEALAAIDQVMVERAFGEAGDTVVVEEFLTGEEASFIALVDGENILPLAGSQDHKAVGEGDTGLNTGGMGAYSPAPVLTEEMSRRAMAAEGRPYRGVLYAGLMIDGDEIKTLEFNARFGDPETQPILYRMKSDIVPLLMASANGSLKDAKVTWDPRTSLCVVMAAGGYPGSYDKGAPISGLDEAASVEDAYVFHAGTKLADGQTVTAGGRVLGVTALGDGAQAAQQRAYEAVDKISWDQVYCRRDIGHRAVARENG